MTRDGRGVDVQRLRGPGGGGGGGERGSDGILQTKNWKQWDGGGGHRGKRTNVEGEH